MIRTRLLPLFARSATAALLSLATPVLTAQAVTIPTVPIGYAGNAADSRVMSDGTTGYGSVAYTYRIGTTEVTNAQYVEFLNSVAATDTYGLYNPSMSGMFGGITRTGSSGSYSYSVKTTAVGQGPGGSDYAYANKPVVYVSWGDAARFANWLHNGQPVGAQDATTTEDGAYTIDGATSGSALMSVVRNAAATWVLPSEDEWYKAAFYDGSTENYYTYATGSNLLPDNELPSDDSGNSTNYWDGQYTNGSLNVPYTDAGAYVLSASPNGTHDQAGNVMEWTEASSDNGRVIRGGVWGSGDEQLRASARGRKLNPVAEGFSDGFRVAYVPEPSAYVLGILGLAGLLSLGRKRIA